MYIKRLRGKNFGILRDFDITIPMGVTGIVGKWVGSVKSNGSGKSTFVDMIPWLCCGKLISGGNLQDVIGNANQQVESEGWFDLNGKTLHIQRNITNGASNVKVDIDSVDITENTLLTNEKLKDLLGFDIDILLATSFFQQAEHDSFTKKSGPAKRKEYIRKLRDIEIFDEGEDYVKKHLIAKNEETINSYQTINTSLEEELSVIKKNDIDNDGFKKKIEEHETQKNQNTIQIKSLKVEKDELVAKNAVTVETNKKIVAAETSIKACNQQILTTQNEKNNDLTTKKELEDRNLLIPNKIQEVKNKLVKIDDDIQLTIDQLQDFDTQINYENQKKDQIKLIPIDEKAFSTLETEIATLSSDIKILENSVQEYSKNIEKIQNLKENVRCLHCYNIINQQNKEEPIKDFKDRITIALETIKEKTNIYTNKEKVKLRVKSSITRNEELTKQIQIIKNNIEKFEAEKVSTNKLITTLIQSKEGLSNSVDLLEKEVYQNEANIARIKNQIEAKDTLVKELTLSISSLQKEKEKLEKIKGIDYSKEIQKKEDDILKIEKDNEEINTNLNGINNFIKRTKEIETKINQGKKKITKEVEDLDINKKVQFLFSKNGVSNSFVAETIQEIQKLANTYLWQIDPTKTITFATEKESGKETLDIFITDKNRIRIYERFSGGEKTTINLSIRLALSNILNQRATKQIGFLVLDEVFGSLCEHNRPLISMLLNCLREIFPQIFVISHTDIQDQFENLIQVSRYETYSDVVLLR